MDQMLVALYGSLIDYVGQWVIGLMVLWYVLRVALTWLSALLGGK